MDEDNIVIQDTDNYQSGKDQRFSHQELVMSVLRKCLESGTREMMSGWFNEKVDKSGNIVRTYIDDTRKKFIESVKTSCNLMSCDFDNEAKTNIDKLKGDLKDYFKILQEQEKNYILFAPASTKKYFAERGVVHIPGTLIDSLPFSKLIVDEQVETYRKILEELSHLTKRLDFYAEEFFEA